MRFNWLVLFFSLVLFFGLVDAQSAQSIESQVEEYALQYENGSLNFLQLQVYVNAIKDSIYQKFERSGNAGKGNDFFEIFELLEVAHNAYLNGNFEEVGSVLGEAEKLLEEKKYVDELVLLQNLKRAVVERNEAKVEAFAKQLVEKLNESSGSFEFKGWTQAEVQNILGEPSFFDEWVWSENLKKDIRLNEKIPRWEKTIFEGKKIKVVLTAHPSIRVVDGAVQAFYWIDLQLYFVDGKQLDVKPKIEKIDSMVKRYYSSGTGKEEIALEMAQLQRKANDFLWKNRLQCNQVMQGIFDKNPSDSEKIRWHGTLFESDDGEIIWNIDEFFSNNWHGFGTWIEVKSQKLKWQAVDGGEKKNYAGSKNEELLNELKASLYRIKQAGLSPLVWLEQENIRQIIDELTRRANQDDYEFSIGQFNQLLEEVFSAETKNFVKEKVSQKSYESLFIEDIQQVKDRWCQGESNWCGDGMSCVDAACVSAKGGNEVCDNKIDDDRDRVIDCEDPDCVEFKKCGRICEPVCGGKGNCWDCYEQNCKQNCDQCGQCIDSSGGNNDVCNQFCQPCNQCQVSNCGQKCVECERCQNVNYGDGCYDKCFSCDDCRKQGNQNCEETLCVECNQCRYDAGNFNCPPQHNFQYNTGLCIPIEQEQIQQPIQQPAEGQPQETIEQEQKPEPEGQLPQEQTPSTSEPKEAVGESIPSIEQQTTTIQQPVTENPEAKTSIPSIFQIGFPITGFFNLFFENQQKTQEAEKGCGNVQCSINQYCKPENGQCECQQGFFDCDGDWLNGCESTVQCNPCQVDSDCAVSRCEPDGFSLVKFYCKEGETRTETRAKCSLFGVCGTKASGEKEADIHFECWGEKFDDLQRETDKANQMLDGEYCREELSQALKKRVEIQNSLNQEFMQWYFSEFVQKNPGNYSFQGESIRAIYEALMQTNETIARDQRCLGLNDWPGDAIAVNVSFESSNGRVRLWEELKDTSFWGSSQKILSPYIELWFFPTKEEFKQEFVEHFNEGKGGPNPREKALIQENDMAMQKIRAIAGRFGGGDAQILIEIKEDEKFLVGMLLQVSEKNLVDMTLVETKPENLDLTIGMQYDFFYNMMSTIIKELEGSHAMKPYWEQQQFEPPRIDDLLVAIRMFLGISQGIVTGQISVDPFWQIPNAVASIGDIMSMMQMAGN